MTTELLVRLPDYFSSLIDAMQDGFILRAPNGTILEANKAFCELVGYPRDEVVGARPPHPWWPPSEQAVFDAVYRKYIDGATAEDDLVYQRRDGSPMPVLVTSSPLRDSDGRLLGFIGTMKDMRERRRAADQIRLQAQLIDQAQTAIIATDLSGNVTVWNHGAEQIFGWARAEALGANIRDLTIDPADGHGGAILERLVAGEPWEGEYLARHNDGSTIAVFVNNAPIHDARGELVGVVGVSTDISARKQAEQRLAAQYELTRVLAEATELLPAADEMLRVLGVGFSWDLGLAWIVDDASAQLRLMTVWSQPAFDASDVKRASAHATLTRGVGLPGHVWKAGAPLWVANVAHDERLVRGRQAAASGLHSALCFPVRGSGDVTGVLEFYSVAARTPDADLLTTLATVGGQVGQFIERLRAVQATRESEDRFRSMADSAPVLLWVAGLDMGCVWFNKVWLEFTGCDLEQELGYGWAAGVHPGDANRCLETYSVAFSRHEPFSMEYRLRRHDGEYRWVIHNGKPRLHPDGSFAGYIGSALDINERKRAEEGQRFLAEAGAILASSLDFRTTLNSVARLVVPQLADWCDVHVVEADGTLAEVAVAHVNPAKVEWATEINVRYPIDPDAPTGLSNVIRTGQSELYPDITDAMLVLGARDDEHLTMLRAVGMASAMIVPMLARDQAIGAITLVAAESGRRFTVEDLALAEDLARRAAMAVDNARLYAEAQEAAHARDRFLAVAAHELRSPLTATKGFAQLLLRRAARTPSGEEWIAPLRTIDNQVNKVATLVNRLLDVSRIQENRLQLQLEPDDLLAIVREAVADQQLVAEVRRIMLTSALSELPGVWDRARIGQVLTNLLDNAIKYSPDDGEISVTVELDEATQEALVSVHDDGAGISVDGRERLFEREFRAAEAASSGLEGMGLGLYVAKGIVDAHGGRIWLESAGGQGTTFHVLLPCQPRPPVESERP